MQDESFTLYLAPLALYLILYNFSFFNNDVCFGYILMPAAIAGRLFSHGIGNIHAFKHFGKYRVAPAAWCRARSEEHTSELQSQ